MLPWQNDEFNRLYSEKEKYDKPRLLNLKDRVDTTLSCMPESEHQGCGEVTSLESQSKRRGSRWKDCSVQSCRDDGTRVEKSNSKQKET